MELFAKKSFIEKMKSYFLFFLCLTIRPPALRQVSREPLSRFTIRTNSLRSLVLSRKCYAFPQHGRNVSLSLQHSPYFGTASQFLDTPETLFRSISGLVFTHPSTRTNSLRSLVLSQSCFTTFRPNREKHHSREELAFEKSLRLHEGINALVAIEEALL